MAVAREQISTQLEATVVLVVEVVVLELGNQLELVELQHLDKDLMVVREMLQMEVMALVVVVVVKLALVAMR
jgi:hypothetical protein